MESFTFRPTRDGMKRNMGKRRTDTDRAHKRYSADRQLRDHCSDSGLLFSPLWRKVLLTHTAQVDESMAKARVSGYQLRIGLQLKYPCSQVRQKKTFQKEDF